MHRFEHQHKTYTQRARDLCSATQQTKITEFFSQRLDSLVDPVHIKLAMKPTVQDTPTHHTGIYPDQDNETSNS